MPEPFFGHALIVQEQYMPLIGAPITGTTTLATNAVGILLEGTGYTVTLPLAATRRGREFYLVKADAGGPVTVARQGSDLIGYGGGGATSVTLNNADDVLHLVSTGVRWAILHAP